MPDLSPDDPAEHAQLARDNARRVEIGRLEREKGTPEDQFHLPEHATSLAQDEFFMDLIHDGPCYCTPYQPDCWRAGRCIYGCGAQLHDEQHSQR